MTACDQIQIDFEAFHAEHPEVWEYFKKFTLRMIEARHQHGSAKRVVERIRWETDIELAMDPVKLNNNYTSRYSRLFEQRYPQHKGFFRKRKLKPSSLNSTRAAEEAA